MNQCVPSKPDGNVGLAFGLVTAAGLSTCLGAALAFVMPYRRSSKNLFLAACLSVAAGVMIYVSFVEIFTVKAVEEFNKCAEEKLAYLYSTLCFFGGVFITYLFDRILHVIQHRLARRKTAKSEPKQTSDDSSDIVANLEEGVVKPKPESTSPDTSDMDQPSENMKQENSMGDEIEVAEPAPDGSEPIEIEHQVGHDGHLVASLYEQHGDDTSALIRMGIFAGIALAFHNFPEGLATFVSVLEDSRVGISVAIAIGIHNIPEGVCVAMPIYYATGSRVKAFTWATLSGLTELVGALLGWVFLKDVITPVVYAILFAVVAGMMVYISLKELLPTAHRYDPNDQVTTLSFVAGMAIMAMSLVLFNF